MGERPTEAECVATLARIARPIILTTYAPDSCIASTRIAIDALDYFGIKATPFTTRAQVWNRAHAEAFDRGDNAIDAPGAHSIGLGHPNLTDMRPDGVWAHVVAVTEHWLIDLSLDQASRPERQLTLGPMAGPRPAFDAGQWYVFGGRDGIRVIYELCTDDAIRQRWQASPNWRRNTENRRLVGQVIRAMRAELESTERRT